MRNHQWRDCKAWTDEGLPLSTTSNEAAKLYDACLTQMIGWYDDAEVGGIVKSMDQMYKADPEFVLGLGFNFGLKIAGTLESIYSNQDLEKEFNAIQALSEKNKPSLTNREFLHCKAILLWAEGKAFEAARIWEDILLDHPTDLHALKMANLTYFYQGRSRELRDSVARVLPVWEAARPPMKSFVYGMYAFGLQETNEFQKAEGYGRKALQENKNDGWSTHSMAHVFESEGRTTEGLDFMSSTVQNWEQSNHLACHNYWHVALFHIEDENYDSALQVLEHQLFTRALESKTMLDILDCSSLLFRLDMLNPASFNSKQTHWPKVHDLCKSYSKHHISTFNDAHFMMTYVGNGERGRSCVDELLESLPTSRGGDLADHPCISGALLRAIADFGDEKFDNVVDALEPLRYKWIVVGGSNAQLEVFNLILIVAALKSSEGGHKKLARVLINERMAFKSNTALNRRFDNIAKQQ